jgi:hypothetical protein
MPWVFVSRKDIQKLTASTRSSESGMIALRRLRNAPERVEPERPLYFRRAIGGQTLNEFSSAKR